MFSNQYIGIPYKAGGRDRSGIDCWGLARLIYQEEYKINLPSFNADYTEDDESRMAELIAQYREGWEKVYKPSTGDLILFRVLGSESHIGIAIDSERFVHVREGRDSCVDRLSSLAWNKRIVGYYRYSANHSVLLNARPHPLKTQKVTVPVLPGTKLIELINWVPKEYSISQELSPQVVVLVNGIPVPRESWDSFVLKEADTVEYRAVPGKDVLRTAALIAVVIYAPYLAGAAEFAMMPYVTSTAMSAAVYTAAYAATIMVGSALINSIAPIRPPELTNPTDPGQAERMYMIDGGTNQRRPYDAIPVILGKVRMTPPIGANNFTLYKTEREQYLRMLLVWGYGPLVIDSATLKIGDTQWNDYTDVQISTLDRRTTPTTTQLDSFNAIYGSDVEQKYRNLPLTGLGPDPLVSVAPATPIFGDNLVVTVFDTIGCDSASVTFNFPEGLRKVNKQTGESSFVDVRLYVSISTNGGSSWPTEYTHLASQLIGSETYKKDAFSVTLNLNTTTSAGTLAVRVRRDITSTKEDSTYAYYYATTLQSVQKTLNTNPAVDPVGVTVAKSAVEIKATGQLSGNVEGISAVVQTWARIWNGSNWNTYAATNNPAALLLYVLTHPGNSQKVLPSEEADRIDLAQLQYWYNYCVLKGFEFNSVVGSQQSILEILRDICAAGRASPALIDGKWTVTIDEPKSIIAQHFTPHNSWGFESSKALPKQPDGLKIKFFDESIDYQENEVTVYNNGKTYETATLFESINLPGVTKKSLVYDHAKWHLSQAKVRPEVYTFNTDLEYIVCTRGDRVKVMHDVPMWGLGSGRIKNRISSTLFELDEAISIQNSSLVHAIRVRGKTNTTVSATIKSSWNVTQYQKTNGIVTLTIGEHPFKAGDQFTSSISVSGTLNTALSSTNGTITSVTSTSISYEDSNGATTIAAAAPSSGSVVLVAADYTKVQLTAAETQLNIDSNDLFLFGTISQESQDLIVIGIEPTSNKTAKLTLVDYGVTDNYNLFTGYSSIIDTSNIRYNYYTINNDTVTLTTITPHPVKLGDKITVPPRGTPTGPDSTFAVTNATVVMVGSSTISYTKTGLSNTNGVVSMGQYVSTIELVGGVTFETQISGLPYNYLNSISTATPTISSIVSDESVLQVVGPGSFIVKMVVNLVPIAQNNRLPPNVQYIEVGYDLIGGNYSVGSNIVRGNFIDGYVELPGVTEGVTYRVKARYVNSDSKAGSWSSELTHTVVGKTRLPNAVTGFGVSTASTNNNIVLTWSPNTDKDLFGYEIRTVNSNWGGGGMSWQGQATQASFPLSNTIIGTTRTYYIRAIDYNGNYSAVSTQVSITLQKPNPPTNINYVYGSSTTTAISTVTISWTDAIVPANGLLIQEYKVEITKPNGNVIPAIFTASNTVTITADWIGDANVRVYSIDAVDTVSTNYASAVISKYKPNPVTNAYATVVDNNVLMYWTLPTVSSLPVIGVKVYKGSTFASSVLVGTKSGAFTSLFELSSGVYTYWITAIDTDNRESDPVSVTATVSQPPDFVFNGNRLSEFNLTKTNSAIYNTNTGNQLLMLVNTTENWSQHFTNNSKTTIQGFVDAGFTYFIQPATGVTSASYVETWDFGTVLGSSSITVTTLGSAIVGNPTVSTAIETSLNGSTWSTPVTANSTFATNFRYIRVTVTVTETSATDLYLLSSLNINLDSKLRNDAGNVTSYDVETEGTIVNFTNGVEFSDVTSITLATNNVTPLVTTYNHKDTILTGNYTISGTTVTMNIIDHGLITGQKVKVYFSSGSGKNGTYAITKINDSSYTITVTGMTGTTGGIVSTYPQSIRVYAYDLSGVRQTAKISWAVKGY